MPVTTREAASHFVREYNLYRLIVYDILFPWIHTIVLAMQDGDST